MRILVVGANGFLGRYIVVALRAAGHDVVLGVRQFSGIGPSIIQCDLSRDQDTQTWTSQLAGIDVVVNAVGILRQSGANTFERVHVAGPKMLFEACRLAGVSRVIQISALGSPEVGEYLASQHRGDAELAKLDLNWTILRPSLVYSVSGSYGGTSLLRALAALPGILCVPGDGHQHIQPVRAEDLAIGIVGLIERRSGIRETLAVVGPERVTLLEYLQVVRQWLELTPARVIRIPLPIGTLVARLGDLLGNGPLGLTMWRMLLQGNVAAPGEEQTFSLRTGVVPLSLRQAFATAPSFVQDRWHAQLYFLGPALRIAIAILWIASGVLGFLTPIAQSQGMFAAAGLPAVVAAPIVSVMSTTDLVLGIMALFAWRLKLVSALMFASVVGYTLAIGCLFQWVWFEPFGGLWKNLPLLPAVLIMSALSRRR